MQQLPNILNTGYRICSKFLKDENDYELKSYFANKGCGRELLAALAAICGKTPLTYNQEGYVDTKAWFTKFSEENPKVVPILQVICNNNRSFFIKSQNSQPEYSAAVPFVPYVFKKYHDVPYSKWDFSDAYTLAMCGNIIRQGYGFYSRYKDDFFNGEVTTLEKYINTILEDEELTYDSARDMIIGAKSVSAFNPGKCERPAIDKIPRLLKLQFFRLWVYEQSNKYILYSFDDPDLGDSLAEVVTTQEEIWGKRSYDDLKDSKKDSPW